LLGCDHLDFFIGGTFGLLLTGLMLLFESLELFLVGCDELLNFVG
jgi:hypothetical protein